MFFKSFGIFFSLFILQIMKEVYQNIPLWICHLPFKLFGKFFFLCLCIKVFHLWKLL